MPSGSEREKMHREMIMMKSSSKDKSLSQLLVLRKGKRRLQAQMASRKTFLISKYLVCISNLILIRVNHV